MQKVTMSNFGLNIFRAKANQNQQQKTSEEITKVSNPFGVSFKGNVIHADVFESSKINTGELQNKVANRGKMIVSALVGNINNFNDSIKSRMNSIVSFGRRIKERTAETWQKFTNVENFKTMGDKLKETFVNPYSMNNLNKRTTGELEAMFKEQLGILQGV